MHTTENPFQAYSIPTIMDQITQKLVSTGLCYKPLHTLQTQCKSLLPSFDFIIRDMLPNPLNSFKWKQMAVIKT